VDRTDRVAATADRTERERKAAIRPLERELSELRGKLDAVLMLLGQKSGNMPTGINPESDIIDLPDWRKRNVA